MGHSPVDEPLTLTRCHSCGLSQLYEALGWKSVCGRAYNLKGIKRKIFLSFLFTVAHFHSMMHADPTVVGGVNV